MESSCSNKGGMYWQGGGRLNEIERETRLRNPWHPIPLPPLATPKPLAHSFGLRQALQPVVTKTIPKDSHRPCCHEGRRSTRWPHEGAADVHSLCSPPASLPLSVHGHTHLFHVYRDLLLCARSVMIHSSRASGASAGLGARPVWIGDSGPLLTVPVCEQVRGASVDARRCTGPW